VKLTRRSRPARTRVLDRDGIDPVVWALFRNAVDAAHDADGRRCAELIFESTDEPSDFLKLFTYGYCALRHALKSTLGDSPTSDQVAALVAGVDTSFLSPVEEQVGSDLVLRAVRIAFDLEPMPADAEQGAVLALAVVAALGSLLKFPLAEITNRRADVAADIRLLAPANQYTRDLLK
jgi:hypothetical protein